MKSHIPMKDFIPVLHGDNFFEIVIIFNFCSNVPKFHIKTPVNLTKYSGSKVQNVV